MKPYLSVVIPAFNEEKRIGATIGQVFAYLSERQRRYGQSFELVIVDDGSSDQTARVVRECRLPGIKFLRLNGNRGKGYAVRAGMLSASGQYRLFTDADHSTPIHEFDKMCASLENGCDVVIGSRNMPDSRVEVRQPFSRRALGRLANLAIQLIALWGIRDTQCGFKAFNESAARQLFTRQTIDRWGFDFEILAIARRMGRRIEEVPVSWYNSSQSRVRPVRSALATLGELLKIRANLWRGLYD